MSSLSPVSPTLSASSNVLLWFSPNMLRANNVRESMGWLEIFLLLKFRARLKVAQLYFSDPSRSTTLYLRPFGFGGY